MSINLMPWRQERRQKLQKDFTVKLGVSALLGVGAVVALAFAVNGMASAQLDRNTYLEENIRQAERDIEEIRNLETQRNQLLGRKNVIERLQASRDQMAHIFSEIATHANTDTLLSSIEHKADYLEIKGLAVSQNAVATLATRLETSAWLEGVEIIIIETKKEEQEREGEVARGAGHDFEFTIRTRLSNPNAPVVEDLPASRVEAPRENGRRNRRPAATSGE